MEEIKDDIIIHREKDRCPDSEKKKRRSSIMKPKVSSQSDHNNDTVPCRSLRRVSFASSNFVKPFAADPDENTIWDRTYEEEVNHTDCSKSSEETQGCASKIMNISSFQIWEGNTDQYTIPDNIDQSDKENYVPIIAEAACGDATNLNQTEMEFTGTYGNCYKGPARLIEYVRSKQESRIANAISTCEFYRIEKMDEDQAEIAQVNETVRTMCDMDISLIEDQDVAMVSSPNVQIDPKLNQIKHKPDATIIQPVDMEFTSNLWTGSVKNLESFVDNDSPVDMEFTTLQAVTENHIDNIHHLPRNSPTIENNIAEKISDIQEEQYVVKSKVDNREIISNEGVMEDWTRVVENIKSFVDDNDSPVDMELTTLQPVTENHPDSDNIHHLHRNSPTFEVNIAEKISDIQIFKSNVDNREIISNEGVIEVIEKHKATEDISTTKDTLIRPIDKDLQIFSKAQASDEKCCMSMQVKEPPPISKNEVITDNVNLLQSHSYDENKSYSTSARIQDEGEPVKASKILYSQPIKSILKSNDDSCNVVTCSKSFTMSLSNMSICAETTQQLIHATFSKPESIDILLQGRNASTQKNDDPSAKEPVSNEISEPVVTDDSQSEPCWDVIRNCKSICDITPPMMDNDDLSAFLDDAPEMPKSAEEISEPVVEKYLEPIDIDYDYSEAEELCRKLCEEHEDHTRVLKELIGRFEFPIIQVVDADEMLREVFEESSSSQLSEGALNDSGNCQKRLSMPDMVMPMSMHERVCEAAQRCGRYWQFVKSDENYYYFFGCFRAVPFKVNVHPELGKVYGIETFNNLLDESDGLTHYEATVFREKLKQEHLLLHLGQNFDLLALLDYVSLCTDEIEKFHLEFPELVAKYGRSHKLKFNQDNSVSFEILEVDFIIWWKISAKFSTLNLGHIESVSATYELDEKVDEGHIKSIAENSLTGTNFLRCFIEKVDEYVQRIGKRILMKMEAKLKYGEFSKG